MCECLLEFLVSMLCVFSLNRGDLCRKLVKWLKTGQDEVVTSGMHIGERPTLISTYDERNICLVALSWQIIQLFRVCFGFVSAIMKLMGAAMFQHQKYGGFSTMADGGHL